MSEHTQIDWCNEIRFLWGAIESVFPTTLVNAHNPAPYIMPLSGDGSPNILQDS